MLFKQIHLDGIRSGAISLAFRKWIKPTVKKGSLLKTSVGQIEIIDIVSITQEEIPVEDAKKAGFMCLEDLYQTLRRQKEGDVYKITVQYHSPDPRIQLREQKDLSKEAFNLLKVKLDRLDRNSKHGSWTMDVLKAIEKHPKLRAADLATKVGKEKDWLKLNIRKLKNLGLTVSHQPGYTLSNLGKIYLERVINGY